MSASTSTFPVNCLLKPKQILPEGLASSYQKEHPTVSTRKYRDRSSRGSKISELRAVVENSIPRPRHRVEEFTDSVLMELCYRQGVDEIVVQCPSPPLPLSIVISRLRRNMSSHNVTLYFHTRAFKHPSHITSPTLIVSSISPPPAGPINHHPYTLHHFTTSYSPPPSTIQTLPRSSAQRHTAQTRPSSCCARIPNTSSSS